MTAVSFRRGRFVVIGLAAALGGSTARAQCPARPWVPTAQIRATSNCVYDVAMNVGYSDGAGSVLAGTAYLHPVTVRLGPSPALTGAGPSLAPLQDTFSIRSWTSGSEYFLGSLRWMSAVDGPFTCTPSVALPLPRWEWISDPTGPEYGVRAFFDTSGFPDELDVTIEVAAHGRTFEDSAVRATMTVRNAGTTPLSLGARFSAEPENSLIKVAVGIAPPDPLAEPLISGDSEVRAPTGDYIVTSDTGTPSINPSSFFSGASLAGPWTLSPPPTPPDRFGTSVDIFSPAFVGLPDHCFGWERPDPPYSRPGGAAIESIGWFWGDTPDTARVLNPGEETSFTIWMWSFFENPVTCDAGGPYGPVECAGTATPFQLDGTASDTVAHSDLLYRWSSVPGVTFDDASAPRPVATFPGPGAWPVRLDVGVGPYIRYCDTTVEVVDTHPPLLSVPAPVVVTTRSLGGACSGRQALTATAVDACAGGATITHVTMPDVGSGGAEAAHDFGFGTTRIVFTATDASGNSSTAETSVTVVDDTPPTIASLAASPSSLWPPNHRLVPVTIDLEASDSCDAAPAVTLVAVRSSEPEDFRGDGRTGPDVAFAHAGRDDRAFMLRAERDGRGAGRTYEAVYAVRDSSGNEARATTSVVVAHDRRAR